MSRVRWKDGEGVASQLIGPLSRKSGRLPPRGWPIRVNCPKRLNHCNLLFVVAEWLTYLGNAHSQVHLDVQRHGDCRVQVLGPEASDHTPRMVRLALDSSQWRIESDSHAIPNSWSSHSSSDTEEKKVPGQCRQRGPSGCQASR